MRSTCPRAECDATICSGAFPCSTHCERAAIELNVLGPSPPAQWPMPGTMNSRMSLAAFFAPPSFPHVLVIFDTEHRRNARIGPAVIHQQLAPCEKNGFRFGSVAFIVAPMAFSAAGTSFAGSSVR